MSQNSFQRNSFQRNRSLFLVFLMGLGIGLAVSSDGNPPERSSESDPCIAQFVEESKARASKTPWIGLSFKHTGSKPGHFLVTYIHSGSAAERAGLNVGDWITGVDDLDFDRKNAHTAQQQFKTEMGKLKEGKSSVLKVLRDETPLKLDIVPKPHEGPALWKFIGQEAWLIYERLQSEDSPS